MNLFDYFQERDLRDLRQRLDRLQLVQDLESLDGRQRLNELTEEIIEARLRLDVLTRLLIVKGIFAAEDYVELLYQTRSWKEEPS